MMTTHAGLLMLALSQLGGNQLNTFENFLQTAVSGIQGSGVIAGMMNVAYVIMLVGFLWEVYQSALHGGDVKGLGKSMVKYLATALVVQAWPTVFVDVNHAFVNAGSWMTTQGRERPRHMDVESERPVQPAGLSTHMEFDCRRDGRVD
jgi:hypothetical protein